MSPFVARCRCCGLLIEFDVFGGWWYHLGNPILVSADTHKAAPRLTVRGMVDWESYHHVR